ncbi:MAG TPA: hypothetical protein PLG75_01485 [Methanoculleus sp.]|nr:hypothetical protein [Methanoculleus sp.]
MRVIYTSPGGIPPPVVTVQPAIKHHTASRTSIIVPFLTSIPMDVQTLLAFPHTDVSSGSGGYFQR